MAVIGRPREGHRRGRWMALLLGGLLTLLAVRLPAGCTSSALGAVGSATWRG